MQNRLSNGNSDKILQLMIVGDSHVGQSNMIIRFCDDVFNVSHVTTIGIDVKTQLVTLDGKQVRLQLWDTAGMQKFRSIPQKSINQIDGFILAFALDDQQSFKNIQLWKTIIKSEIPFILVGNQCDLDERSITNAEIQEEIKNMGNTNYFETSAKSGKNINESFMKLTKSVLETQKISQNSENYIKLADKQKQKESSCC